MVGGEIAEVSYIRDGGGGDVAMMRSRWGLLSSAVQTSRTSLFD